MKTYEVYQHPVKGYAAAKKGFSWPGLFFGIFWALIKKLWKIAGLFFLVHLISHNLFRFLVDYSDRTIDHFLLKNLLIAFSVLCLYFIPVAIWIIIGFKGNKWFAADLVNRGYRLLKSVDSTSPDAAIALVAEENK